MPSPMAKPSPQSAKTAGGPERIPLVPFIRGATEHAEPFFDSTFTLGATQQNLGPIDVASYGFMRALVIQVNIASSGNSATVALQEDAPWVLFAELTLQDVNGAPLFGPHTGYELYLHHKYGGFRNQTDPKLLPLGTYTALTTGAGATAGSGIFTLRLNVERTPRDGFGSLANMNASQAYKLRGTINNLASIFSTAPNGTITARVRVTLEAYSQPNETNAQGQRQATVPPANQSTGFSSRFQAPTVAGANTIKHTRVGNLIRELIYVNRRAGTSRANGEADLANQSLQWYVDSRLLTNYGIEMIRERMADAFEYVSGTFEAAGGPDNGVFVLPFNVEFSGKAGYEMRDLYLPTTQATRLELVYSLANSGVLTVMTDDVAPRGTVYI
jgi:hypothetical protein